MQFHWHPTLFICLRCWIKLYFIVWNVNGSINQQNLANVILFYFKLSGENVYEIIVNLLFSIIILCRDLLQTSLKNNVS